jgi:hypothetical protein
VVYQSLLSIFDSMDPNERLEFIELATAFRDLSPEDRAYLVEEANGLACLGKPQKDQGPGSSSGDLGSSP